MAFSAIAYTAPNYRDFKNYWIKAYWPGTTTPLVMALDEGGSVTVAKLELNKDGFIVSAGAALVIPYINQRYDLWMFPTEAEADANDTVNAERIADNILPGGSEGNLFTVSATFIDSTSFSAIGDQVAAMATGQLITLNFNISASIDTTILSASFDGSITTITVTDAVVTSDIFSASTTNWPYTEIQTLVEYTEYAQLWTESDNPTEISPDGKVQRTISGMNDSVDNIIYSVGFQNVGVWAIGKVVQNAQQTLTFDGEEYNTTAGPFDVTVDGATPTLDSEDWFNVTLQDRKSVARARNVPDIQVIYSTDTAAILDNVLYILDSTAQESWSKPSKVGAGETIQSVVGNVLTTDPSSAVYTLVEDGAADINNVVQLQMNDGVFPDWPLSAKVGDVVPAGVTTLNFEGELRIMSPQGITGSITAITRTTSTIGGTSVGLVGISQRAPYIQAGFKGLRISDFIDTKTASTLQTSQLQDAVDALNSNNRYDSLDLEGLFIQTDDTIVYDQTGVTTYFNNKKIKNGTIAPKAGVMANDQPALKLLNSSGRLERLDLESIGINCNKNSAGIGIDGSYTLVSMSNVLIRDPQDYGVKDNLSLVSTGGDLSMVNVRVNRTDPSTPHLSRITTGFDLASNDAKFTACLATYCRVGIHLDQGSALIANTHIYQGTEDDAGTPIGSITAAMNIPSVHGSKISNCYIDGSFLQVNLNGTGSVNRISVDNTIFTTKDSDSSYRFAMMRNGLAGGYDVKELALTNCTFRSFGSNGHPSGIIGSSGTGFPNLNTAQDVVMDKSNSFWNVNGRWSDIEVLITLTGAGTYVVNLTGLTPYESNIQRVKGMTFQAGFAVVTPPTAYVQISGKVLTVVVANDIAQGDISFVATINAPMMSI